MEKLSDIQIKNLNEWMSIEGFEGLYEVNSREGLVRNSLTLKVLKLSINYKGYPVVGLWKDRKLYLKTVHRIVATAAFGYYNIPIDGLLVMHLDEERNNPRIDNLAIGTQTENLAFPKAKQRRTDSRKGKHLSSEVKKKISESRKGEKHPMFGKCLSEETRMKMSQSHKGNKNPNFGKRLSEEHRKKISEALAKKTVAAYKDDKLIMVFQSTKEAGRNGFNSSNVSKCCTGKQNTHKGYQWKYL